MLHILAAGGCLFGLGTIAFLRARKEVPSRGSVAPFTFVLMFMGFAGSGVLVVAAAYSHIWPLRISSASAQVGGLVIALAGLALCLAARLLFTFRRAWGLDFDLLVTRGVYRWSRNPQVLAWFLIYCGIGWFGRSAGALVIAGLFMIAFVPWILAEERALEKRFGEEYRRYRRHTRRFL